MSKYSMRPLVEKKPPKSVRAVLLLRNNTWPFKTPDQAAWAALPVGQENSRETEDNDLNVEYAPLASGAVRDYLHAAFFRQEGDTISAREVDEAIATVRGEVRRSGRTREMYNRLAPDDTGGLWLDLGDERQRMVHVSPEEPGGWRIWTNGQRSDELVQAPYFHRPRGYAALPTPKRGGSLQLLRRYVNCPRGDEQGDQNFVRMLAWLIGAFMPHDGDYAHLLFTSEKGSGKSVTATFLRSLIDPNTSPLREPPSNPKDVIRHGSKAHVLAYDNLSSLTQAMSDSFCRLATGLNDAQRKLYTDNDEILYSVRGPAILTGIHDDFAQADDLLQRLIPVKLTAIPEERRESKRIMERDFERDRPYILGALLEAVAEAVKHREAMEARVTRRPRLGDLAVWLYAAEPALLRDRPLGWKPELFERTLAAINSETRDLAIASSSVLDLLLTYLSEPRRAFDEPTYGASVGVARSGYCVTQEGGEPGTTVFTGTYGHLLHQLTLFARTQVNIHDPRLGWPAKPKRLSTILRAAKCSLAERGLTWGEPRRSGANSDLVYTFHYRPAAGAETRDAPDLTLDHDAPEPTMPVEVGVEAPPLPDLPSVHCSHRGLVADVDHFVVVCEDCGRRFIEPRVQDLRLSQHVSERIQALLKQMREDSEHRWTQRMRERAQTLPDGTINPATCLHLERRWNTQICAWCGLEMTPEMYAVKAGACKQWQRDRVTYAGCPDKFEVACRLVDEWMVDEAEEMPL